MKEKDGMDPLFTSKVMSLGFDLIVPSPQFTACREDMAWLLSLSTLRHLNFVKALRPDRISRNIIATQVLFKCIFLVFANTKSGKKFSQA